MKIHIATMVSAFFGPAIEDNCRKLCNRTVSNKRLSQIEEWKDCENHDFY